MIPEAMLVAILIIVFIADFASSKSNERKWFNPLVSLLMFAEFVLSFFCMEPTEAFGGMYVTSEAANIMKIVLSMGTIIVLVMSRTWIYGKHNVAEIDRMKTFDRHEGEFYMLVVSTLLGMNIT